MWSSQWAKVSLPSLSAITAFLATFLRSPCHLLTRSLSSPSHLLTDSFPDPHLLTDFFPAPHLLAFSLPSPYHQFLTHSFLHFSIVCVFVHLFICLIMCLSVCLFNDESSFVFFILSLSATTASFASRPKPIFVQKSVRRKAPDTCRTELPGK